MRIQCPFCGERDLSEFGYLGDGHIAPARRALEGTTDEFVNAVYFRDNPLGPHRELWLHAFGCHRVLQVRRDTLTHQILEAAFPDANSEE
jgi:heterotetrameric sarcosine oxidase delta subunit